MEVLKNKQHSHNGEPVIQKPKSFDEMKTAAKTLSENIPFVRVDFYEINEKPLFGEMTFTPGGGFISHYKSEFLKEYRRIYKFTEKTI